MGHRVILAAIAIAVIGVGYTLDSALARGGGGGGHGGFGGHGGVAGRSGFSGFRSHAGPIHAPDHFATRGSGFALGFPGLIGPSVTGLGVVRPSLIGASRFPSRIIRPEVIAVSPMVGSGAIVPPFTVPIVPPFGATGSNALPGGLPVVVTPFVGTTPFGSGFIGRTPVQPDPSRSQAALLRNAPRDGVSNEAQPSGPLAACHPVPCGYHCDWPS
jgi:hypothetical protein